VAIHRIPYPEALLNLRHRQARPATQNRSGSSRPARGPFSPARTFTGVRRHLAPGTAVVRALRAPENRPAGPVPNMLLRQALNSCATIRAPRANPWLGLLSVREGGAGKRAHRQLRDGAALAKMEGHTEPPRDGRCGVVSVATTPRPALEVRSAQGAHQGPASEAGPLIRRGTPSGLRIDRLPDVRVRRDAPKKDRPSSHTPVFFYSRPGRAGRRWRRRIR